MPDVFICYAHKDEPTRAELVEHLRNLDHLGINAWSDRDIPAGNDWLKEIGHILETCDAAVLLVSPQFLNSRFIKTVEVPALLKARADRGALVIPLIVQHCNWQKQEWLSPKQARPWEGKPLKPMKPGARAMILSALALEIQEGLGRRQKPEPILPTDGQRRQIIELTLNSDYDPADVSSIEAMERALRDVTGDPALRIRRVAPGSLRIFVELPPEALQQLRVAISQGFLRPPGVRITSTSAEVELVSLRGQNVLLDETLAVFFDRKTKEINQARDRNSDRFDADYAFQLTHDEWAALQSQYVTAKPGRGGRRTPPWAYTEQGSVMLATVLRTPRAREATKLIVEVFVAARKQARPVPPGNHDGIGDPAADSPEKQAFKQRLSSFDPRKPDEKPDGMTSR
ncbi:MAG: ORF6N domain-containing protein [Rhodobacter sp.]